MKKYIVLVLISIVFLYSCDVSETYIKVSRTVTKDIVLNFNINSKGNFTSSSFINAGDIIMQFDDDPYFRGSEIETLDIHSIALGVQLDPKNTAKTLVLNILLKQIGYDGTGKQDIKLVDDTKTIQIQSNTATDILSGIGNAIGVDKNKITLHNVIDLVNTVGAVAIKNTLENAFRERKAARIDIDLNGKVPNNEQAVMKATISMNASLTYLKCQAAEAGFIFGMDEECKL